MSCPVCGKDTRPSHGGANIQYCEEHGNTAAPSAAWWRPRSRYSVPEFFVRGDHLFDELARLDPPFIPSVVFDVGANTGQSTHTVKKAYPKAKVYAFEAVKSTFERLVEQVGNYSDVSCHNVALAGASGQLNIQNEPGSVNNSVCDNPMGAFEIVTAITGDDFCSNHNIHRIDFLKIDTEGYDLEVLKGFRSKINNLEIRYIEVEAGMNLHNDKHVYFEYYLCFFGEINARYDIFGLYEQVRETKNDCPLRRANIVFQLQS